jgi:hypothetical protein
VRTLAVLYTSKDIQKMLEKLRIKPIDGKVTTQEAARILTQRAKEECNIDHTYTPTAVRRHIHGGHLNPERKSTRKNMYPVESIFDLPIKPRIKQDQHQSTSTESVPDRSA